MAVIVKYIVVRNGVEKMTFATKKEADAYDKMLDIADNLFAFIETAGFDINETVLEDLSLFLAENRDSAVSILRGSKPASGEKKSRSTRPAAPKEPGEKKKKEATKIKK